MNQGNSNPKDKSDLDVKRISRPRLAIALRAFRFSGEIVGYLAGVATVYALLYPAEATTGITALLSVAENSNEQLGKIADNTKSLVETNKSIAGVLNDGFEGRWIDASVFIENGIIYTGLNNLNKDLATDVKGILVFREWPGGRRQVVVSEEISMQAYGSDYLEYPKIPPGEVEYFCWTGKVGQDGKLLVGMQELALMANPNKYPGVRVARTFAISEKIPDECRV
jgi:hypothetical protein